MTATTKDLPIGSQDSQWKERLCLDTLEAVARQGGHCDFIYDTLTAINTACQTDYAAIRLAADIEQHPTCLHPPETLRTLHHTSCSRAVCPRRSLGGIHSQWRDPSTESRPIASTEGWQSEVNLPLKTAKGTIGFLQLCSRQNNAFVERHIKFLEEFSSCIGQMVLHRHQVDVCEQAELHYRAAFDHASVGIVLYSPDRHLIDINRTMLAMLGYDIADIQKLWGPEIIHPEDFERSTQVYAQLESNPNVPVRIEKRYKRKDGVWHWVDVSVGTMLDCNGKIGMFVAHVIDISDRKAMQARLEEEERQRSDMERELRQAQKLRAVGQLAAGIAHEINTPAQYISDSLHFLKDASAELLGLQPSAQEGLDSLNERSAPEGTRERLPADELAFLLEQVPKALDLCLDGVQRIAAIVQSMKEFAHPDGRLMCPVDINRAIQNTVVIAKSEYKYVAEVELQLGAIPMVTCHGGDINQVLLNLLVNAAHAIADVVGSSGSKGLITVRSARQGDSVHVSITDTGSGIPDDIRERIFEPFFTTKAVGKGTGQGLAMARSVIIERHQGRIDFESTPGGGTTFTVQLPIGGPASNERDTSR